MSRYLKKSTSKSLGGMCKWDCMPVPGNPGLYRLYHCCFILCGVLLYILSFALYFFCSLSTFIVHVTFFDFTFTLYTALFFILSLAILSKIKTQLQVFLCFSTIMSVCYLFQILMR